MSITTLRDRLIAADPGFVRLQMAARATGAVGMALAILLALRQPFHLSLTVPLLGAALGMTWTIAVNDSTRRDQRITTLVLWLPAAACLTIGTLTASNRILSDSLFVIVLFFAVYVRKYGQRGVAIGTISAISFFFALFLRVSPHDLLWLLLALGVTDLSTYVFRFIVFRDRPEFALRSAVAAFRARQRLILDAIAHGRRRALSHHLFRLNETALGLDDILADPQDRVAVLDAELATSELVQIDLLTLRDSAPVRPDWTPRGPFRIGTQLDTGRIQQTTRQAVQLSAAGALAIVLGELLSPQRWYWAVLAAFVVFIGTSSSVETRSKAWSSIAGTTLGVAAGVVVTYPLRGHDTLAFCMLLICLFLAVYTVRLSYAFMIFFITIVLSLLYVLLGFFSDQLLLVRLIETALGAALGGIAATLLLPISTQRVLFNVSIEALHRLDELVGSAVDRLCGDTHADTLAAARRFDEVLQSVRTQIEPLTAPMSLAANDVFHMRLMLMAACGQYARALVALAYKSPEGCPVEALRKAREAIAQDIRAIIAINAGASGVELHHAPERPAQTEGEALTYLHRIERALHGFAQTLVPSR